MTKKLRTKTEISQERKALLRCNKKHFSSFLKILSVARYRLRHESEPLNLYYAMCKKIKVIIYDLMYIYLRSFIKYLKTFRSFINSIDGNLQYPLKKLLEFLNLYYATYKNIKVIIYNLRHICFRFVTKILQTLKSLIDAMWPL